MSSDPTRDSKAKAGPALPPALLEKRPEKRKRESEKVQASRADARHPGLERTSKVTQADAEESDDEIGPRMESAPSTVPGPTAPSRPRYYQSAEPKKGYEGDVSASSKKRDSWMLEPPKGHDWAQNINPTQMKSRQFKSGKASRGNEATYDPSWASAPDSEKQLPSHEHKESGPDEKRRKERDEATRASVDTYDNERRQSSLAEMHRKNRSFDDPSKRPFDREKDVLGGQKVDFQRLNKADRANGGLNGMFSKGTYL